MTALRSIQAYRQASTQSVSPGKLVLMLFDGALRFMTAAELGFKEENFARRNEQIHNNLMRTEAIINELQDTLNLEIGGEFGKTMFRLYDYMREQIRKANWNKEVEPILIVQGLLTDIRNAWAQMLEQNGSGQALVALTATC